MLPKLNIMPSWISRKIWVDLRGAKSECSINKILVLQRKGNPWVPSKLRWEGLDNNSPLKSMFVAYYKKHWNWQVKKDAKVDSINLLLYNFQVFLNNDDTRLVHIKKTGAKDFFQDTSLVGELDSTSKLKPISLWCHLVTYL